MLQINHLSTVWCLCSTGYGTVFICTDWEADGWRAESPFPWHQGADFRWLINRQQAENDGLIDKVQKKHVKWSENQLKVRGRDCGDEPAAWLSQFMGEALR